MEVKGKKGIVFTFKTLNLGDRLGSNVSHKIYMITPLSLFLSLYPFVFMLTLKMGCLRSNFA